MELIFKMGMLLIGWTVKNAIPLLTGAAVVLVSEHGFKWTFSSVKEWWNRNTSSIKDDIKNPPGFWTKVKRLFKRG